MGNRLAAQTIELIKEDIKKGMKKIDIMFKHGISIGTVYRIKNDKYNTRFDLKEKNVKNMVFNATIHSSILNFIEQRKNMIFTIKRIMNSNSIIVNSDCYSNKFKQYKLKFLYRNVNLFFFVNLENNRVMCFKFGDFLAQNIKVVFYE